MNMVFPKNFHYLGKLCHSIHEPFDDPDIVIYRYWRTDEQKWEYSSCIKWIVARDLFNEHFDSKGKPRPEVMLDDFINAIRITPSLSELIKSLDK